MKKLKVFPSALGFGGSKKCGGQTMLAHRTAAVSRAAGSAATLDQLGAFQIEWPLRLVSLRETQPLSGELATKKSTRLPAGAGGELQFVKFLINPAAFYEVVVSALLHDFSLFQNYDYVRVQNRGQAVRDADGRAVLH